MKLVVSALLGLLLPALVSSQINCHRCFGNSYCNDPNRADFLENVRNATCPTPTSNSLDLEDDDPFMTEVEKVINRNIREQFDDQTALYNTTVQQHLCVTATVQEVHDTHTLRTCITRIININPNQTSPSLCSLISAAIVPAITHNSTFWCMTCNGNFCNTHTLRINHGSNLATVPMILIILATLIHSFN